MKWGEVWCAVVSKGEDALEDAAAATVAVVNVVASTASALASLRPPGTAASTTQN